MGLMSWFLLFLTFFVIVHSHAATHFYYGELSIILEGKGTSGRNEKARIDLLFHGYRWP
jgi:hypothetical protein